LCVSTGPIPQDGLLDADLLRRRRLHTPRPYHRYSYRGDAAMNDAEKLAKALDLLWDYYERFEGLGRSYHIGCGPCVECRNRLFLAEIDKQDRKRAREAQRRGPLPGPT